MKHEMNRELDTIEKERALIAKEREELLLLQNEVATQALNSSMQRVHKSQASIGAVNFADFEVTFFPAERKFFPIFFKGTQTYFSFCI